MKHDKAFDVHKSAGGPEQDSMDHHRSSARIEARAMKTGTIREEALKDKEDSFGSLGAAPDDRKPVPDRRPSKTTILMDNSDEDTEEEEMGHDIESPIAMPRDLVQRVKDITMSWSMKKHNEEAIAHVVEWFEIIMDDDEDKLEQLTHQASAEDAILLAFLVTDTKNLVHGIHSIGVVHLKKRDTAHNGQSFGFQGDVHKKGTKWMLPTMLEFNAPTVLSTYSKQYVTSTKACEQASKNLSDQTLLPATSKSKVTVVSAMPLPLAWLPYFLGGRSPGFVYSFFRKKKWQVGHLSRMASKDPAPKLCKSMPNSNQYSWGAQSNHIKGAATSGSAW
jgi:hypothetical protein